MPKTTRFVTRHWQHNFTNERMQKVSISSQQCCCSFLRIHEQIDLILNDNNNNDKCIHTHTLKNEYVIFSCNNNEIFYINQASSSKLHEIANSRLYSSLLFSKSFHNILIKNTDQPDFEIPEFTWLKSSYFILRTFFQYLHRIFFQCIF